MFKAQGSSRNRKEPDEIYISLVSSLYSDPKTLTVGSLGTIAACAVTAVKTMDPVFAQCVVMLTVVSVLRIYDTGRFARQSRADLTMKRAHAWEVRYTIGSSVYVLLMGMWCFLAFARTADPLVQLLSFSMTLVNMIGVAGRNYGSKTLVTAQLTCAGIPLLYGLFWMGDVYYAVSACVIAPFFISFKTIADKLRQTLSGAVDATNRVQLLADQLDSALNNMAHGLCMIDASGGIVISNERLPDIIGVNRAVLGSGRSALRALLDCVHLGVVPQAEARRLLAGLRSRRQCGSFSLIVSLTRGRLLMLTFRAMLDGSAVVLAEDVTEQRNAAAQIDHLAHHDSLTDLPNRVLLREKLCELLLDEGNAAACAILLIDLDEFKQVNDTLGHPCGDELLKLVAERLRSLVGDDHLIARLGGDEFVLLLRGSTTPLQPAALANDVIDAISLPYDVKGHMIMIGASIGIALAPADGRDPDVLLKNADMALYRAKSEGRGKWRFFEVEMDVQAKERRALQLDLRRALQDHSLELYFQPLIDLQSGKVVSCEALLRWQHPERGYISPAEFVPVAEEMGLIVELGRWVLMTACREAASWPAGIKVAVNLSPIQFRHKGLLDTIQEALRAASLPPSRLEVEITESLLLNDTVAVLSELDQLKALGVSIALDDFGTGYSSLSYLRKFPLDIVKIDRSFLLGIETTKSQAVLLRGTSSLCRDLGLSVTVEGVETDAQLDIIKGIPEIQVAQGYLFSKPAPAYHVRQLLAALSQAGTPLRRISSAGPRRAFGNGREATSRM